MSSTVHMMYSQCTTSSCFLPTADLQNDPKARRPHRLRANDMLSFQAGIRGLRAGVLVAGQVTRV